ncbi:TetR/AcrR family transcriptional regulator [Agreia pratensis]|uniref:TetR/AcrR family transcriptional regulator n=1 Tax=Agreia pratensis TaxID=150121 RepID=UPI001FD423CB|nr:TetR/AcrR family transcriptional regulator [Agreia pratensis]
MTNDTPSDPPIRERMPAAERRELILGHASAVFGRRGYSGTTTEQIAQAAGISQPYVVRMFGTKEKLFVEVMERALGKLIVAFREIIRLRDSGEIASNELGARLGQAYVDLIEDRGILMSLMQGFIQGHDDVIGRRARAGFLEIYRLLRDEAGIPADDVRGFLADGMLINTLLAIGMPDNFEGDEAATELMTLSFGAKLDAVLCVASEQSTRPV